MIWGTFAVMLVCFVLLALVLKLPVGIATLGASVAALVFTGRIAEWPQLVEGSLTFLDAMLVIATAMVFMRSLTATGRFQAISKAIVSKYGNRPIVLLPLLMLLVMFPGMLTGSSTAAVLTSGALVAPVLLQMGLDKVRVAAIVAMGGIFGMVAPPVNLPVMIIGSGVDMPYSGFTLPLLLLTLPLAWITVYILGFPVLRKNGKTQSLAAATNDDVNAPTNVSPSASHSPGTQPTDDQPTVSLGAAVVPVVFVVLWMVVNRIWPTLLPPIGLPLLFTIGAVLSFALAGKGPWLTETMEAIRQCLPVLSILAGSGAFIQIMTLVGVRGALVVSLLSLPKSAQLAAMGLGIPLFGVVSAFGSASVLGVPFLLALLSKDQILVGAALSMLSALGDLMPPTALAGRFAAKVVGLDSYAEVLRKSAIPILLTLAAALITIGWIA